MKNSLFNANILSPKVRKQIAFYVLVTTLLASMLSSSLYPATGKILSIQQPKKKTVSTKSVKGSSSTNSAAKTVSEGGADTQPDSNNPSGAKPGATPAATPQNIPAEQFEITPSLQISRGTDTTLSIENKGCKDKFVATDKVITSDLKKLEENGIKLTPEQVGQTDCVFKVKVTVAPTAPSKVDINLALQGNKETKITLTITKEEPLPPRPIPPGLTPQVDVMWRVVPQKIVKDNFGTHVGKLFYCLEVIIGNNSGYDLQIAAVGFEVGPLGDATKSMAELLKKSYKETDTTGEILVDAAQAKAKAATDEAIAAREKGLRDLKAEALALETSHNLKPTDKEMDEACAKNSDCINLEKKAAEARSRATISRKESEIKNQAADEVSKAQRFTAEALITRRNELAEKSKAIYQNSIPTSAYRMTRGSLEHGQFWSVRNLTINSLRAFGPFLTGFTPYFHVLNHQKNYAEAINIISNPLEKGFELVVPDETISQLQRLDEQILRDGMIIQNNRQVITHTFMPKDNLGLKGDMRDDPLMVTLALGKLTIIGNQIQYLNRVSVTSGPSGEVTPPPVVSAYDDEFPLGADQMMTITGTNLGNAKLKSDDPQNIDVTIDTNTDTSLTAHIVVKDTASLGSHTLNLTTPSRTAPLNITITQPLPQVDKASYEALKDAQGNDVTLKSLPEKETPYPKVKLTGRFLQGAKLTAVGDNPLIAKDIEVASDGKSLTMTLVVPTGTKASDNYRFQVHNEKNQTKDEAHQIVIKVATRGKPQIGSGTASDTTPVQIRYGEDGSASPPTENPDKDVDVPIIIDGDKLNDTSIQPPAIAEGSDVKFGVTITSQTPKRIKAVIKVPKQARAKDEGYTFQLVDADKNSTPFTFKLGKQPQVSINQPAPLKVKEGQSAPLILTGEHLESADIVKDSVTVDGNANNLWSVKKDTDLSKSDGGKLTLNVKAPTPFASAVKLSFKVSNLRTNATVTVDVTPDK